MKSISATERTAILVCLCGVFGVVLADVFGGFVALRFFQFSVGMSCIFGAFFAVSDGISRLQHRIEIRKRKLVRLDRKNERLRVIHAESGGNFFHVDTRTGTAEAYFRPAAPRRVSFHAGSGPGTGIDAAHRPDAATILSGVACALVCGGRGAGKTELARWVMAAKVRSGWTVAVIDPKPSAPGKWTGCRVIGTGHDYAGIQAALSGITGGLRAGGHRAVVIIDELPLLNMHIRGFSDLWLPVLLEGREYGFHCWLIAQSKTAGSLGLSGRYDLMECFDAVAVAKRDRSGSRWVEIEDDSGSAPIVAEHPGPFHDIGPAGAYQRHGSDIPDAEWTEPPGMDDAPEPGGAVRRVAGLIDFVRLSGPARRVLAYVERNGAVNRGKLLASRCISKKAKAPDYDTALEALETAGRIAVDRSGPMAKWTYRV